MFYSSSRKKSWELSGETGPVSIIKHSVGVLLGAWKLLIVLIAPLVVALVPAYLEGHNGKVRSIEFQLISNFFKAFPDSL